MRSRSRPSTTAIAPAWAGAAAAAGTTPRAGVFPDWVQINFSGSKTIDHVIVYSMQDNFASPVDPPATMTFTPVRRHRLPGARLERRAWVTLGSVAGNNLVKRTVNFTPTATDRIRVNITGALAGYSRMTEIEAWGN